MNRHPHLILVSEIDLVDKFRHVRYFRFPLDADKMFCTRSRTMINAFAHSKKRRNYKPDYKSRTVLYHFRDWEDYLRDMKILSQSLNHDPHKDIPLVELGSIKEFFTVIGYDYKRKKWL